MVEIDNYKVVPIRLTPDAKNCHVSYMREHFIRHVDAEKPKGRTLLLLNIPPYVTEENLKTFFSKIGDITSVLFAEKPGREECKKWQQSHLFSLERIPSRFKVAFIVFRNTTSIAKVLKFDSIDLFDDTGKSIVVTGIAKWQQDYNNSFLNESKIQTEIDQYMEMFDAQERRRLEAERNAGADEDGWITVGKQGRNAGFEQKESVINRLENKIERSRKDKELKNFYTFQIRESKMKNIVSLRKKFEEDKNKIEILKKGKRFKPF